ncbi:heterokaryon incompatibility protein-domain-containing protein, partial [Corynascus similis CBS 632.67]
DEIRLLKLLPGHFDDPIKCYLEHTPLASAPYYDALSYTWGDATQTSPIVLDDAPYPITTNLEAALRYLRDPQGVLSLWVDAVCINQLDIKERNIQVPRMRDIYEQPGRTVVWLGDYPPYKKESVGSAFAFVERVFEKILSETGADAAVQSMVSDHGDDIRVLNSILQRPWFNRVWVIQEIAMCKTPEKYLSAPDEPGIVLGYSRILFTRFCLSISVIAMYGGIRDPPEHFQSRGPNDVTWIFGRRRMRNELLTGHVALNQAEQLVTFASRSAFAFEATDERDKLYALLGLLSSRTLPLQLQPDYALTAERIFLDYAVYMLEETKYLDILACSSGSRPGFPSWVPDWKVGVVCEYIHAGKVSHIRFLEGNKKLEVECVILSHVTRV